jgi:DEAD/DEAH box helicase domain-containing protein
VGGLEDAVRSGDADRLVAVVRLDDSASARTGAQNFRDSWRGFLAAFNLLQFLPCLAFTTSEEIAETGGLEVNLVLSKAGLVVLPVEASAEYAAEGAKEQTEMAAEVRSLLDLVVNPSLRSALTAALRAGAPVPEVGFELLDARGLVEAEAEIAWPVARVAVVLVGEDGRAAFEAAGWTVHDIPSFTEVALNRPASLHGRQ